MRERIPGTIHQERSCAHRQLKHSNTDAVHSMTHGLLATFGAPRTFGYFHFQAVGGLFVPCRNVPNFIPIWPAVRGEWRTSVQFFVCCFLTSSSTTVQWLAWARAAAASANFRQKPFFAVALQSLENDSLLRRKTSISCASFFDASLPSPLGGLGCRPIVVGLGC